MNKKPIFVIGGQRSGTTWLANILCRHSDVAGIQDERHYGIHESDFFASVAGRYGSLKDDNNFIEFLEVFSASDYFKLSGLRKEYFYEERPKSYQDFFSLFMEKFAESEDAKFWLEKSPPHTFHVKELKKYYPEAKFIGIKRDMLDSVKSAVKRKSFSSAARRKAYLVARTIYMMFFLKELAYL